MKDLNLIAKGLYAKIEKLVHLQDRLEKENGNLLAEKQDMLNQIVHLKLALTLNKNTEHRTDIKLKINELVREIDKCIALLNR